MTTERLQKFLSRAGVASRRTAEEIILAGRVAVNGQVVTAMGVKVDPDRDVVKIDGSIVKVTAARRTVMLHKPYGYVCTTRDPEGRRVVTELLGKGSWPAFVSVPMAVENQSWPVKSIPHRRSSQ